MFRNMSKKAKRIACDAHFKSPLKKLKNKDATEPDVEESKLPSQKIINDIEDINSQSIWMPDNWEKTLANIREMRKNKNAPVDTMGCDKCVDEASPLHIVRFQSLVSLMLSSQTKDEVTFAAMERLKNMKTGLNIDSIIEVPEDELGKIIYPVGFWKRKAKYIKETAKILKEKYHGDIPDTVQSLCALPGVGPKMAYLCMKSAWGIVSGIGVDTHVHRISNRIGWVQKPTKTPEQTRIMLESWLPKKLWEEVNHLLVGFGQQTCKPVKPLCTSCINQPLCPFGRNKK